MLSPEVRQSSPRAFGLPIPLAQEIARTSAPGASDVGASFACRLQKRVAAHKCSSITCGESRDHRTTWLHGHGGKEEPELLASTCSSARTCCDGWEGRGGHSACKPFEHCEHSLGAPWSLMRAPATISKTPAHRWTHSPPRRLHDQCPQEYERAGAPSKKLRRDPQTADAPTLSRRYADNSPSSRSARRRARAPHCGDKSEGGVQTKLFLLGMARCAQHGEATGDAGRTRREDVEGGMPRKAGKRQPPRCYLWPPVPKPVGQHIVPPSLRWHHDSLDPVSNGGHGG